ncbi:hypothetical protein [Pseudomonas syringae]|uniref:hypothetical protein n=1 Tax=Pseudomonas syringae TaxID=317 RepID=UPI000BB5F84A|nr:hypothetical protein [Pseudomonas syringae]PBP44366.1 hypothetical protein CCL13_17860 [Pseudomonas syringae]
MMVDSKTTTALDDNQKERIAHGLAGSGPDSELDADLALAEVTGVVDPVDGTLNKDVLLGEFLEVTLLQWAGLVTDPGDFDTFFIDWAIGAEAETDAFKEVFSDIITAPVAPGTFPKKIQIPLSSLMQGLEKPADGTYSLRYRIRQPNDQQTTSPSINLIVDTTPPGGHSEPEQMILDTDQLTQAYLDEHPDGLVGTLPDYYDWAPDHRVAFYYVGNPLPEKPEDLPPPVDVVNLPGPTNNTLKFPVSVIGASRDDAYYIAYFLIDKATNRTPLSNYKRIDVALGLLPDNLQDPVVPLAENDNLIDLPDAGIGVQVSIKSFDNWKPTDRIEVTWGAGMLRSEEVGSYPEFPLLIRVPGEVLRAQYNLATGGDQATNVSYRILRGILPSAVKSTSVNVNFSTIGPDPITDPGWPDPVNDALPLVEVRGKTSDSANVLTAADKGEAARVLFKLYINLQSGEMIDFYWGTRLTSSATYTVLPSDAAGSDREVEIPWDDIFAEGNRVDLPVHYRIHAPGSANTQHSKETLVNVSAIVITPDAPLFEGTSTSGWLNCDSLFANGIGNPATGEPGIRVRVPDLSKYLSDGETVTLHWYASTGTTGDALIPGTEKEEAIVLGADHPATGFTWLVTPYATHILPVYNPASGSPNGSARIKYSFIMSGATETITSLETTARVGMYDAVGACPIVFKSRKPKKK